MSLPPTLFNACLHGNILGMVLAGVHVHSRVSWWVDLGWCLFLTVFEISMEFGTVHCANGLIRVSGIDDQQLGYIIYCAICMVL